MKLFMQYLKQRRRLFGVSCLFAMIFIITFLLYRLPLKAVLYPFLLCGILGMILIALDFLRVKRQHTALTRVKSFSDVSDILPSEKEDILAADYQKLLRLLAQEHSSFAALTEASHADMAEYYTLWVHQIKTPIASMRLTLEGEDSPLSRKLSAELNRVEQYVEMVLVFLRLGSETTDYVFREQELDPILRSAVKKFAGEFIDRKLRLVYEPVNVRIVTDEKWLSFVVEQILSNALKYTQAGSIAIWMDDSGRLHIRDTGMGIAPEDLPRIFEKGYTGLQGRTDKRASGIGLYLCKRICNNLGHGITVESVIGEGTTVTLDLAQWPLQLE